MAQSVLLIILQIFLLRVCIIAINHEAQEYQKMQLSSGNLRDTAQDSGLTSIKLFDLKNIWRWRNFKQYLNFYAFFIVSYILFYGVFKSRSVIDFTGLISNICDASVALP